MKNSKTIALAMGVAAVLAGAPAHAGTQTYTGTGSFRSHDEVMPLNNGDGVVSVALVGVAAISTTPPRVMSVNCSGMGLMTGTEQYAIDYYCSFTDVENDTEGFDIKGVAKPGGADVEIVGGSGKWAKATGTGTIKSERSGEDDGSFSFVFEITTP